jgi:hypothetical protein
MGTLSQYGLRAVRVSNLAPSKALRLESNYSLPYLAVVIRKERFTVKSRGFTSEPQLRYGFMYLW